MYEREGYLNLEVERCKGGDAGDAEAIGLPGLHSEHERGALLVRGITCGAVTRGTAHFRAAHERTIIAPPPLDQQRLFS